MRLLTFLLSVFVLFALADHTAAQVATTAPTPTQATAAG